MQTQVVNAQELANTIPDMNVAQAFGALWTANTKPVWHTATSKTGRIGLWIIKANSDGTYTVTRVAVPQ